MRAMESAAGAKRVGTLSRAAFRAVTAGAAAVVLLSGCTAPDTADTTPSSVGTGLPSPHVHALDVDAETGQVLLATHGGLFDVTGQQARKVGPPNDLMGFTAGHSRNEFFASGHPGQGSTLPNPLGLIRSSDGGETWEAVSRQGQSDFHALAVTVSGIVAFDGTLRTSPDGKTWTDVNAGFEPAVLAGHPDSNIVLATTPAGVQRSVDGGATWTLDPAPPVIEFADFASPDQAAGVEPDGTVYVSTDAGATWTRTGQIEGQVQAISVVEGTAGKPEIWAATADAVIVSTDGGATFTSPGAS